MKQQIIEKLEKIVKELTNPSASSEQDNIKIELTISNDDNHGDYSSNIALRLGKILGRNPLEIAEEIASRFKNEITSPAEQDSNDDPKFKLPNSKFIEKVEAVAPGFVNFYLSKAVLTDIANSVLASPEKIVGIKNIGQGRKAVVEYSSPNIAKPFTIGHLRSTIIGDAIANLLEATGYDVYRDNHLGDWGTQFGKQIYAVKTWGNEEALEKSENPIKDLVTLYVKFHEEAENPSTSSGQNLEEEGRKWFKKLEDGDEEARRLWKKCIDWSFKEFDRIYKVLRVSFTENDGRGYGEAFFEDKMEAIIAELKKKGLLKESRGAQVVFFPDDKYPPLMIIKADGATLYATRDLATDKFRLEHYGKDVLIINEVGAEQSLYFKQLFETEYMLGWYKPGQRVHIGHGLFRWKEGKMSTRKGNAVWLDDVLREAEQRAKKLGSESENTAKVVGIGALKWNDLKRSAHLDVIFDWDEVLSMQGNSGPYVQYTYTRTQSILTKSENPNIQYPISNIHLTEDELRILRHIQKFGEIVESAAATYSPNVVTEYLFTLSQIFNNFYQKYRILNAASEDEKEFRLALTATVGIVIKQGLHLLGIQAPEKM